MDQDLFGLTTGGTIKVVYHPKRPGRPAEYVTVILNTLHKLIMLHEFSLILTQLLSSTGPKYELKEQRLGLVVT